MFLGLCTGLLIVFQAWILAKLLHALIVEHIPRESLLSLFLLLLAAVIGRTLLSWLRERVGFRCGMAIRQQIRGIILDKLQQLGPAWIQRKQTGNWVTILLEQIEEMQDFYSRYLPQMYLALFIPLAILAAVFPINWAAGLILLVTAPLIPLFMILVGMGAADANRRNFVALGRLSANFLDRLRGLETLRLFHRGKAETEQIKTASEGFRSRTMEVLRLAFLSSAVLEFFTSVSIAVVAVYFGFSYLGELDFGHYGAPVTLFAGFLALILAPEYFQPLRDLGTFYHAKAQALGAADSLVSFLQEEPNERATGRQTLSDSKTLLIQAENLEILTPEGICLAGPLNFTLHPGQQVAVVGHSGAGKSSLLNLLLGFLPYRGSLKINGTELRDLAPAAWYDCLSWVGQNPHLPASTIRENILLANPDCDEQHLNMAVRDAHVEEFLSLLPDRLDTIIGDGAARLSVGQAQRVAVARALIKPASLLLLDEPTASLDANSEQLVMQALTTLSKRQSTILVTHRIDDIQHYDEIWVMEKGLIVQQGDFQKLSQREGPFFHLLSAQRLEL